MYYDMMLSNTAFLFNLLGRATRRGAWWGLQVQLRAQKQTGPSSQFDGRAESKEAVKVKEDPTANLPNSIEPEQSRAEQR